MSQLILELDIAELAWENLLNDEHAEIIANAYPSHSLEVEYIYSAGRPAKMYESNGDPGYPEDPEEIEIILDAKEEAGNIAVAILVALPSGNVSKMTDSLFLFRLGLEDYLNNWQENIAPDLAAADGGS